MNDPTQFEQVDETCEFGGAVLYSESLGITAFFENAVPSKYETQKLKQLQFGIENEKIRQFEHECLIRLFQWSFLPPGKALDFSVCDEAFGCYKTQYRKRHSLEICQNASFLSTPDIDNRLFRWNGRFFFTFWRSINRCKFSGDRQGDWLGGYDRKKEQRLLLFSFYSTLSLCSDRCKSKFRPRVQTLRMYT